MNRFSLVVFALCGGLALVRPASAADYTVFQGTIIQGEDFTGAFGRPGTLQGSFTAIFQFDPTGGLHQQGVYSETVYGGPGSGYASPIVGAELFIGGHGVVFPGPAGSYGAAETANLFAVPGEASADVSSYSQTLLPALNASLQLHAYTLDAPTRFVPYIGEQADYYDPPSDANWSEVVDGQELVHFSMSLEVTRVILTDDVTPYLPPPSVPEPATWALTILGMAACGSALRRRRSLRLGLKT